MSVFICSVSALPPARFFRHIIAPFRSEPHIFFHFIDRGPEWRWTGPTRRSWLFWPTVRAGPLPRAFSDQIASLWGGGEKFRAFAWQGVEGAAAARSSALELGKMPFQWV
jgi:hypothetical protein